VGLRFNPPPGWPSPPECFVPAPGWQPDPSWPPAPPGWQLWVDDGQPDSAAGEAPAAAADATPSSPGTAAGPASGAGSWGTAAWVPQAPGTSGLAIAALILGLLGFTGIAAILAIIFGIIALTRISRLGLRGRGMAIAGLVLGCGWIGLVVLGIGLAAISYQAAPSTAGAPSSGSITGSPAAGQRISVFSLVAGDCFDNPTGTAAQSVSTVVQTSCNQPHNAQIYATFKLTGSIFSYPGQAKIRRLAQDGCNARTKAMNRAAVTDAMTIRFLFPVEGAWLGGQRTVSCMIVNPTTTLRSSVLAK
jgi:hypothetical protein